MKITKFPKANLDAVLVSCAKLKKAFDSLSDKNRQLSKLLAHQSKLEREIATIHDDPKPGNVEQAKSLGAATADLEITKKAIGKIQIPQHLLDLLGNETRTTAHQASLCLRPTHEAYTAKVAEDLREWCADDKEALILANQTGAVKSLVAFTSYRFGGYGGGIADAAALLTRIEQIEAGEIPWSWTPGN